MRATDVPLRDKLELDLFKDHDIAGERIMLDTCVLIDQLQGRLPKNIEERIVARTIVHSPIVVGELSFLIGRIDPSHIHISAAIEEIHALLEAIQDHSVMPLATEDFVRGNILAGCMSRLLSYPKEAERKMKNDALLAAQAARLGCLLITRNIADFDRLSQVEPRLKISVYDR